MHILIVDDDTKIRELLKKYLQMQGYAATTVESAEAAEVIMRSVDFDLIILDVMMGGKDGVQFARELREVNTTPIIMLTARGAIEDRLLGFEAGVDDFLPKPFDPRELSLRIEAVMRRVSSVEVNMAARKFGDYVFELKDERLSKNGTTIPLTRSERDLLKVLVERFGEDVTRADLIKAAHLDDENSRAVDVQMTRLRKKIEDNPKEPIYLQTVRNIGYKLTQ